MRWFLIALALVLSVVVAVPSPRAQSQEQGRRQGVDELRPPGIEETGSRGEDRVQPPGIEPAQPGDGQARPSVEQGQPAGTQAHPPRGAEAPAPSVEEARARVEHHLREADQIIRHFEQAASADCLRFASDAEWNRYFDGEVDRVTLLVAHVEQAWVEAKRVGDDDVRRAAKAPRRRLGEARGAIGKLRGCAADNGAKVSLLAVWSRIERDVPGRQAAIALPR
jgi:hypothetical protein